ncbi:MAG: hypothetical protein R2684_10860 [Pyrinomonadaceae bacterium]
MTEALYGVLSQALNQIGDANQVAKNPVENIDKRKSFDSYLQNEQQKGVGTGDVSGRELDAKLERLQQELSGTIAPPNRPQSEPLPPELLDARTRMGLLQEAKREIGEARAVNGVSETLLGIESNYNEVAAIMSSDQKLTPGQLLALQARLYQVSQHIEVMSKVVDQMAGGIKTVLNTNV